MRGRCPRRFRFGIRWIIDSDWMLQALCARHVPAGGKSFRPVAAAGGGTSVRLFEVIDAG